MSGWSMHKSVLDTSVGPSQTFSTAGNRFESLNRDVPAWLEEELFLVKESSHFCTKENVLNSVAYINQEFQLLGLPCIQYTGSKSNLDVVFFINRLYDLLTIYHKTKTVKEDLENRNHRLLCDIERHKSTNVRLTKDQDQSGKNLDEEKEKLRQITQKYKQMCAKLKTEKDEVKRLTAVVQSRDVQFKHEQKKKEREVFKLKERLHQLLSDKVPERKVGMDLQNLIGRNEGKRSTWKSSSGKQEEEMYHLIINNYEDRHKEVMLENQDLRDCLLSLQRELSTLLKQTGDMAASEPLSLRENISEPPSSLLTDLDEGYFQMPYDIIRHEIERTFKDTCNQIKENVSKNQGKFSPRPHQQSSGTNNGRDSHLPADSGDIEKLKLKIKKYEAIIQEQEGLIQQSLCTQTQSVESTLHLESQLFKTKESLSEQERTFQLEKRKFEKEKQSFTEAVLRFTTEKRQLQDDKTRLLKNQLLSASQWKENQQKKLQNEGHSPRLLPATPVYSSKSPSEQSSDNL